MGKFGGLAILLTVVGLLSSCTREKSNLGDQYFQNGEYQQAIEEYSKVLAIKPRIIEVIYNRGRAYQELGDEINATVDFEKAQITP